MWTMDVAPAGIHVGTGSLPSPSTGEPARGLSTARNRLGKWSSVRADDEPAYSGGGECHFGLGLFVATVRRYAAADLCIQFSPSTPPSSSGLASVTMWRGSRIIFEDAFCGPLPLGYASYFGLGLFVPGSECVTCRDEVAERPSGFGRAGEDRGVSAQSRPMVLAGAKHSISIVLDFPSRLGIFRR